MYHNKELKFLAVKEQYSNYYHTGSNSDMTGHLVKNKILKNTILTNFLGKNYANNRRYTSRPITYPGASPKIKKETLKHFIVRTNPIAGEIIIGM